MVNETVDQVTDFQKTLLKKLSNEIRATELADFMVVANTKFCKVSNRFIFSNENLFRAIADDSFIAFVNVRDFGSIFAMAFTQSFVVWNFFCRF